MPDVPGVPASEDVGQLNEKDPQHSHLVQGESWVRRIEYRSKPGAPRIILRPQSGKLEVDGLKAEFRDIYVPVAKTLKSYQARLDALAILRKSQWEVMFVKREKRVKVYLFSPKRSLEESPVVIVYVDVGLRTFLEKIRLQTNTRLSP